MQGKTEPLSPARGGSSPDSVTASFAEGVSLAVSKARREGHREAGAWSLQAALHWPEAGAREIMLCHVILYNGT